jgi:hypothetical protein
VSALRIAGAVAAIIGGSVSLVLLLIASTHTPTFLLVMFIGWVALPFVILAAGIIWNRISDRIRTVFSATSIVITLASIGVYSYFTFLPLATTPARTWLLTPGLSLMVIGLASVFELLRHRADR